MKKKRFSLILLAAAIACLAGFTPPSGRPPVGPLKRTEPKLYDLAFSVTLSTAQQIDGSMRQNYNLHDTPVVMPLIFMGTYSKVNSDSVAAKMWLDSKPADPAMQLKSGYPFATHLAVMNVSQFTGQSFRWQLGYRVQSWSSQLDEAAAQQIPWPKEWPKDVQDGLQPQMYIESNDPIFADTVKRVSEGKLRMVTPYMAAKDLIRYCCNEIQVNGDAVDHGEFGVIRGLRLDGAKKAATNQRGSVNDLVCVCVAMLRAAGIPARPVIGAHENERDVGEFVTWGEFYLPDCGWIPFDPDELRGRGVRTLDIRKPWPYVGTIKNLNDRIPLAYHFMPAATVESPRNPAVWGWDPRPWRDPSSEQVINISITGRGKGEEDPR